MVVVLLSDKVVVVVLLSGKGVTKIDEALTEDVEIAATVVGAPARVVVKTVVVATVVVESLCSSPLSSSSALDNAYPPTAPPKAPVKFKSALKLL